MVLEGIARAKDPERVRAGLMRAAPMGRMGKAEEVANTILFLASDEVVVHHRRGIHGRRGLDGAMRGRREPDAAFEHCRLSPTPHPAPG